MIAIVDYGLGNVQAFLNIYKQLNIPAFAAKNPCEVLRADHIIIPGVGSFDSAVQSLNKSGMRDVLDDIAINDKKPVLGVCVGLQMMLEKSEEGSESGLGWFKGNVRKLSGNIEGRKISLPHMGWNSIEAVESQDLFRAIDNRNGFYFLHSYFVKPDDRNRILALAEYGETFACALRRNRIYGVQFHPEKSHKNGVQVLKNFATI
jgi:glutamine amidotransferase